MKMINKWVVSLVLCILIMGMNADPVLGVLNRGEFVPCCNKQSISTESQVKYYRVEKGDTLWDIAKSYNVDLQTVMMINKLDNNSILSIGQTLEIPYRSSRIHYISNGETMWDIASRYDISVQELLNNNPQKNPRTLKIGDKLNIPSSTYQVSEEKIEPSRGFSPGTVVFAWPLIGTITSNYGWRKSGFHHGLDIAGDVGNSVRASKSGVVTFAAYRAVYGRTVVIDHPDERQTLYAHLQTIYVKNGEEVSEGQIIATVGTSGNTTGPHLHFEVRKGKNTFDPLNYLR